MQSKRILLALTLATLFAAPAWAAEIDGFQPACGAPGDLVLIRGSDFADEPEVSFGTLTADIVKSRDDAIVCRVPADASTGGVTISVDGTDATDDFTVVAEGTPVVYRLSAEKGTADMPVFVHGRRLKGCTIAFVDESDVTQSTIELRGGRRAAFFKIPDDLDAGTYTLVFTNEDSQDSGDCSPTFEVVEAGDAALTAIDPDEAAPGARIVCTGTDLGPPGPCKVLWTDENDEVMTWWGFSNGYDEVKTSVPFKLEGGATYDVQVQPRGKDATEALSYTLGDAPAPSIETLRPDVGPSGSVFSIHGEGFCVFDENTSVSMSDGTDTVDVRVLFKHRRWILAKVPADLADGDYDVTVAVGEQTSEAATFTVGALPLAVTRMMPKHQSEEGTKRPIWIVGSGFGSEDDDVELQVLWNDGTDDYEGKVLFRTDRKLVVLVPGGTKDPLPTGTYTVSVVLDPDGDADSVEAGTYTVK